MLEPISRAERSLLYAEKITRTGKCCSINKLRVFCDLTGKCFKLTEPIDLDDDRAVMLKNSLIKEELKWNPHLIRNNINNNEIASLEHNIANINSEDIVVTTLSQHFDISTEPSLVSTPIINKLVTDSYIPEINNSPFSNIRICRKSEDLNMLNTPNNEYLVQVTSYKTPYLFDVLKNHENDVSKITLTRKRARSNSSDSGEDAFDGLISKHFDKSPEHMIQIENCKASVNDQINTSSGYHFSDCTINIAPPHLSTAPPHPSTAPPHPSTAPLHLSTAPPQSSTAPPHPSTAPPHPSTAPPQFSTAPPHSSTAPPQFSTAPPHSSTAPLQLSTAPPHLSTALPHPSTAPLHLSTAPPQSSTAPLHPSTAPPHPSTAPLHPSTAPPHPSTAPLHPSTAPLHPSTAPPQSNTAPPHPSTAPPQSTTAPPHPSTAPPHPSTAPLHPSTAPPHPSTCLEPTNPQLNSVSIRSYWNISDPLLLSQWPAVLAERREIISLPAVHSLMTNTSNLVVYWMRSACRAGHNHALASSIWLARRLSVPVIAVTIQEEEYFQDVPPSFSTTPATQEHSSASVDWAAAKERGHPLRPASTSDCSSRKRRSMIRWSQLLGLHSRLKECHIPLLCLSNRGNSRSSSCNSNNGSSSGGSSNNQDQVAPPDNEDIKLFTSLFPNPLAVVMDGDNNYSPPVSQHQKQQQQQQQQQQPQSARHRQALLSTALPTSAILNVSCDINFHTIASTVLQTFAGTKKVDSHAGNSYQIVDRHNPQDELPPIVGDSEATMSTAPRRLKELCSDLFHAWSEQEKNKLQLKLSNSNSNSSGNGSNGLDMFPYEISPVNGGAAQGGGAASTQLSLLTVDEKVQNQLYQSNDQLLLGSPLPASNQPVDWETVRLRCQEYFDSLCKHKHPPKHMHLPKKTPSTTASSSSSTDSRDMYGHGVFLLSRFPWNEVTANRYWSDILERAAAMLLLPADAPVAGRSYFDSLLEDPLHASMIALGGGLGAVRDLLRLDVLSWEYCTLSIHTKLISLPSDQSRSRTSLLALLDALKSYALDRIFAICQSHYLQASRDGSARRPASPMQVSLPPSPWLQWHQWIPPATRRIIYALNCNKHKIMTVLSAKRSLIGSGNGNGHEEVPFLSPCLPSAVRTGSTADPLFNAIQRSLLCGGLEPVGRLADHWVRFILLNMLVSGLTVEDGLTVLMMELRLHSMHAISPSSLSVLWICQHICSVLEELEKMLSPSFPPTATTTTRPSLFPVALQGGKAEDNVKDFALLITILGGDK